MGQNRLENYNSTYLNDEVTHALKDAIEKLSYRYLNKGMECTLAISVYCIIDRLYPSLLRKEALMELDDNDSSVIKGYRVTLKCSHFTGAFSVAVGNPVEHDLYWTVRRITREEIIEFKNKYRKELDEMYEELENEFISSYRKNEWKKRWKKLKSIFSFHGM
jgi:phosphatidylserine/phosphatidylglycerophosphate/cardiolipin synthase-like enzyme